ncbi:MAG: acetate kinase, partial [Microbacterium sp.]
MSAILVINSGSSSLKYSLIDIEQENLLASGLIERIGQDSSPVAHTVRPAADVDAVPTMLDATYRSELP